MISSHDAVTAFVAERFPGGDDSTLRCLRYMSWGAGMTKFFSKNRKPERRFIKLRLETFEVTWAPTGKMNKNSTPEGTGRERDGYSSWFGFALAAMLICFTFGCFSGHSRDQGDSQRESQQRLRTEC